MIFNQTALPGAVIVDVERREDARGYFGRTYCEREFGANGLPARMVQTNMSLTRSAGTLRGMHYQLAPHDEDKLVRCVRGAIWDAIVDIRPESATFCQWIGVELSETNSRMLLVPKG
ncbi:MAG: rfbC, partial [Polaromonas sp.]|nr:rfbC [Polaromonas sp.]